MIAALLFASALSTCAPPVQAQEWMSRVIYSEARGESIEGQIAVGWSIRNRAELYGVEIIDVVITPGQFSVLRGKPQDERAWLKANVVAQHVLCSDVDPTRGATHFHAVGSRPGWASKLRTRGAKGRHLFYARWGR